MNMSSAIAASWLNTLTIPAPAPKPEKQVGTSPAMRYTPEQKLQLGRRICNQSFIQSPPACDNDILFRLKSEAGMAKSVARTFLYEYKAECGLPNN